MKAVALALLLSLSGVVEAMAHANADKTIARTAHPFGAPVRDLIGGHAPNSPKATSFEPTPSIFSGTGITADGARDGTGRRYVASKFGRSTGSFASSIFQGGQQWKRGESELQKVDVLGSEMQRKRSSKFPWPKAPLGECMNWREVAAQFSDPATKQAFLKQGDNAKCAQIGAVAQNWCYLKDRTGESGGVKSNEVKDMWAQYC